MRQNSFLQDNDGVTTVTKADTTPTDYPTEKDFEFGYLHKLISLWEELEAASMQDMTMTEQVSHYSRIRSQAGLIAIQVSHMNHLGLIPALEPKNG